MEIQRAIELSRPLKFNVRRREPELVPPAKPTPIEFKRLSDLDNEESLRLLLPTIGFYPHNPSMVGKDPVKIIRKALSKVLVFYYPLAGRIREWPNSNPKLVVECTGEGAIFIEADANVTLDQLGDILHPPYPYLDDVMYDVSGMEDIIDGPAMHMQVTRLKCGGFIIATCFNHNIMDGTGIAQFLTALGELARGASQPSILPIWDRDRLFARNPPRVTCIHHEFEEAIEPVLKQDNTYRIFYFTKKEIATLKRLVPLHMQKSTSFELITGFLWRCRTSALQFDPKEEVRVIFAVEARNKYEPPLPKGFYGNAFAFAASRTTAGELCENDLGYAVELVVNAKNKITEEYMRSFIDGLTIRGWPRIASLSSTFFTSDLRKMGYLDADFGWGKPYTSTPAIAWYEPNPRVETDYVLCKTRKGEYFTVVPMCLPSDAMKLFEKEIYSTLKIHGINPFDYIKAFSNKAIKSNL